MEQLQGLQMQTNPPDLENEIIRLLDENLRSKKPGESFRWLNRTPKRRATTELSVEAK